MVECFGLNFVWFLANYFFSERDSQEIQLCFYDPFWHGIKEFLCSLLCIVYVNLERDLIIFKSILAWYQVIIMSFLCVLSR